MDNTEKRCSNCGGELRFLARENLQLGRTGWLLGDLPNLLAGALDTAIWYCPACGKLEFYLGDPDEPEEETDRMAQVQCPACGAEHDLDDPKCPVCGAKNPNLT